METAILSVIAGAIISYFIAKWQMKRNKITHFSLNSYDIGKGLSDEFPEFKLHFAGEALANNVMVLKGGFMNTGRNDIIGLKGEKDIKLILPDGCKVKAITVDPSIEGLAVFAEKDNKNENVILFGINEIFRTDEFFKYTAIIETSEEIKELYSELEFSHRLSNTDKIKNTYVDMPKTKFKKIFSIIAISISVVISILVTVFLMYRKMTYNIYEKSTNREVRIHIDPNSNIYVNEGVFIPFVSGTKISQKELLNDYKMVPITEYRWSGADTFFAIDIALLVFIYVFLAYYVTWGRNGHIKNVLKANEKSK